jgi:monovalent cation:H+ antiporter-2, CPA2 family
MHAAPLISTVVFAFVLAFAFGLVVQRFRLPPLVGYLLAGIALGPFTPGIVADQGIADQLAEIGVILLMFGVGLHFSLDDLLSVRAIAVPGALVQALVAIPLGMGLAWWMGWSTGAGLVVGIDLAIASTVVVLRMLQDRRLLDTERGKITVGWLIVQDLAMVLVLVLLPVIAGLLRGEGETPEPAVLLEAVALTLGKIAAFVVAMLLVGKKLIPALLHYVAHTGSRELFRLAVLSIALGFAYGAAELFGVSLALGAFFAGMILSESRLSQQAATESLPLRDAFAVLFFVSVGMLFNPHIVVAEPVALIATLLIVVVAKTIAAYGLVRLSGYGPGTATTVSAALAQIGEFSFILAGLGVSLAILPTEARDLIIATAILSILMSPLLFAALDVYAAKRAKRREEAAPTPEPEPEEAPREPVRPSQLKDHVVLIGHGRVGSAISKVVLQQGIPIFVIEDDDESVDALKAAGVEALSGNAADPEIIAAANLGAARCLFVAIPEAFEGGQVVEQARAINPSLPIIARAHSEAEIEHLAKHGANLVVMGEHEIAKAMLGHLPNKAAKVEA